MNIQALMKQAQTLQKDMMKTKEEIDNMTFTGTSSFVSVTVKGNKEKLLLIMMILLVMIKK